ADGLRARLRGRGRDGIRRCERRHRPHLPRASVAVRSGEGSGARRGQTYAEPLTSGMREPGDATLNDTTPSLAVTRGALIRHLEPELIRRDIVLDGAQVTALARLQRLYDELVAFKK